MIRSIRRHASRSFSTKVFSWGNGDHGQLGHVGFVKEGVPPTYQELLPKELPILSTSNIQWLAAGNRHSAAINENGQVLTWGSGGKYRLGHGTEEDEQGPRIVEALIGENIIQVECGEEFTCALDEHGKIYTWGSGGDWSSSGALGHGNSDDCPYPTQVKWFDENDPENPGIVQIAAGKGHILALDGDGQVWSWGKGDYGRLGNGGSQSQVSPQPVELFEEIPCMFVAAGEHFSGAISDEGKIWMWGRNDQCQLGLGGGLSMEMYSMEDYPTPLGDNSTDNDVHNLTATYLSLGEQYASAIFDNGDVYSWGGRTWIEPQRMSVLSDKGVYQVACGKNFTAALDGEGKVYTWTKSGVLGRSSALGHGDKSSKSQPTLIEELALNNDETGERISTIAAGREHMLACKWSPDEDQTEVAKNKSPPPPPPASL